MARHARHLRNHSQAHLADKAPVKVLDGQDALHAVQVLGPHLHQRAQPKVDLFQIHLAVHDQAHALDLVIVVVVVVVVVMVVVVVVAAAAVVVVVVVVAAAAVVIVAVLVAVLVAVGLLIVGTLEQLHRESWDGRMQIIQM